MKPDWKDAPEWANWLAMDEDGFWLWHENRPNKLMESWSVEGLSKVAQRPSNRWAYSLEGRPQTTKPAEAGSEGQGA